MLKLIDCGWYMDDNPRKEYLRYALNNFDDLDIEEKIEAVKYLYDSYFTIIYDEEYQKIFLYGHGYISELNDKDIKEMIEDSLTDWTSLFDVIK